jgi:Predicted integral membrane protein
MLTDQTSGSRLLHKIRQRIQHVISSFQSHRWQWLLGISCFFLVNGYIGYLLYKDWGALQQDGWNWLRPDIRWLALTAVVQFIGLLFAISGWWFIMRQFGYDISFRRHYKNYTIASLARKLPGIGWDIISRVYLYQKEGGSKVQVSIATVTETIILGVSSTIIALITLALPGSLVNSINPWILVAILAVFVSLVPTPLFKRFLDWLNRYNQAGANLRWQHLFAWVGFNLISITLGGVGLYCFCSAFGFDGSASLVPVIQCWALVMVSGIILAWIPADLGVTNGIIIVALSTMMPAHQAIVLLVAWRVWNTINEIVWGGIGLTL